MTVLVMIRLRVDFRALELDVRKLESSCHKLVRIPKSVRILLIFFKVNAIKPNAQQLEMDGRDPVDVVVKKNHN